MSNEGHYSKKSKYYIYTPSLHAQEAFFYPISTGYMHYEPGYFLERSTFDSFLIMYIQKGMLYLEQANTTFTAQEGQFVLLNCHKPHSYRTEGRCENLFLHFDGHSAPAYYNMILERLGNVFSLPEPYLILKQINTIYRLFDTKSDIIEVVISKYITDILTDLSIQKPLASSSANNDLIIRKSVSYITNHLTDNLSVDFLAEQVALSPYHFIRIFKKGTGFTPHQYILNIKINTAKFLLSNTHMTIKEICYTSGFSSDSIFSTTFKKYVGVSPNKYRNSDVL